jgi:hypothetical protein
MGSKTKTFSGFFLNTLCPFFPTHGFYLGQHLELLAPLVEVDESLGADHVRNGGVDHDEVGEEGAEVGDGPVADAARVLLVLLQHLLQVVVLLARRVREARRSLAHQQLALRHRVVLLAERVKRRRHSHVLL